MSAMTTFIPLAANRSAIARPIPLAPPVTTATRFLSCFMMIPFYGGVCLQRQNILYVKIPTFSSCFSSACMLR